VGTPSFSAAAFSYNGQSLDMTITLAFLSARFGVLDTCQANPANF